MALKLVHIVWVTLNSSDIIIVIHIAILFMFHNYIIALARRQSPDGAEVGCG
jgi:hypothetical protein